MLFQLHAPTLFHPVCEFAVCPVQDHWQQLPPAPPSASASQFFPFPWKVEIMFSLKVLNSSVLLTCSQWRHVVSESSRGVSPCYFWMSVKMPLSCGLSPLVFTLQDSSYLINSYWTPSLCRSLTNLPLYSRPRQSPFCCRPISNKNIGLFLGNFLANFWLSLPVQVS